MAKNNKNGPDLKKTLLNQYLNKNDGETPIKYL